MSATTIGTAWAFLVVSDPQQADSLSDQSVWAEATARDGGWTLTRTISGVSTGKYGPRALTLGMISDLKALAPSDRPRRILLLRLDRLGRGDGLEAMNAFLELRRLGVTVHTRMDGDINADRASELLMPVLRFFIGGMENEVRRDKLIANYDRRRKAKAVDPSIAVANFAPYGLRCHQGHFVSVPAEASVVRFAFELKGRGYGNHLISKRLGALPPLRFSRNGRAFGPFTPDRVGNMLSNANYCGTIVAEDTWRQAQHPVSRYAPPKQYFEYPLGGVLQCSCGRRLIGVRGSGLRSAPHRYYRCCNMLAHRGHMPHYRSDMLERQFLAILERLAPEKPLTEAFVRARAPDPAQLGITSRIAAAEKALDELLDRKRAIFDTYEKSRLPLTDFRLQLFELEHLHIVLKDGLSRAREELEAAKLAGVRSNDVQKLVDRADKDWQLAPLSEQRALARAVCNAFGGCVVSIDGQLSIANPEGR